MSLDAFHRSSGLPCPLGPVTGDGTVGAECVSSPAAANRTSAQKLTFPFLSPSSQEPSFPSWSLTPYGTTSIASTAAQLSFPMRTVPTPALFQLPELMNVATVNRPVQPPDRPRSARGTLHSMHGSDELSALHAAAQSPDCGAYHSPPFSAYISTCHVFSLPPT